MLAHVTGVNIPMRTVKVNNRIVKIPTNATAAQVKTAAHAVGIEPIVKGAGGVVELRGITSAGLSILLKDNANMQRFRMGRHTFQFDEFGYTSVERSNAIGSGRGTYWPARTGHMNIHQIKAEVWGAHPKNRRLWSTPRCFSAPKMLLGRGWDKDPNSYIIRNAPGEQYDNEYTLPERIAQTLIRRMCGDADQKRKRWEEAKARPAPKPNPKPHYQVTKDTYDTRSVKLFLLGKVGVWQKVDITKTLTPIGLAKMVVIHRNPKKLRVFWHDGFAKDQYTVEGMNIPLVRMNERYYEGKPTTKQWQQLGIN